MRLEYWMCDDWFIYATDKEGMVFYVCTELWPEWTNLHEGSDEEDNAIEKYMLPIALSKWTLLNWKPSHMHKSYMQQFTGKLFKNWSPEVS